MKIIKQTFLTFEAVQTQEVFYEISVKLQGNKYILIVTEDVVDDGIPISSKKTVPPYSRRESESLEKILVYFNAYIDDLRKTRIKKGWVLADVFEKK